MDGKEQPGSVGLAGRRAPRLALALSIAAVAVAAFGAAQASAAVSFTAPTNHPVGDGPFGAVSGDFNGDSDPDLAVANRFTDNVSILLGGPGSSFAPAGTVAVGDSPLGLAVGDFNGDADPDLAVANSGTPFGVSVLLGGAGGSFGAATNFAVGTVPFAVGVGDFNADSDPDLAVANQGSDNVSVLLGAAGGSFAAKTDFAAGDGARSIAVGDFNGDADPDLAVANQGNGFSSSTSILLGAAGGGFGAATNLTTGFSGLLFDVQVADFNGDSDPDLATSMFGATDQVLVRLGAAGGSFGAQTPLVAGNDPFGLASGDFNADADPDLAVANDGVPHDVSVLLGGSGGGFGGATNFALPAGAGAVTPVVADFDGDSDPDLAVTDQSIDQVSILLNTSRPAVGLSPASLGFGSRTLNTTSAAKGVVVSNSGDAPLEISDVRIVGTDQLDFEIVADECEGATVTVGDGCVVRVTFTPGAGGARSASLRFIDNAPGSPHSVPLTGTGAVPKCAGVPATIVGTSGPDHLTGTAGVDIVALLGDDDGFSGGSGADQVCGGSGSDSINGGPDNDKAWGHGGDDDLRGASGDDTLRGGSDDDDLFGGTQTDVCDGGSDLDTAAADCETASNIP